MTATGLFLKALVAIGREPQSRAFLRAPGTDELYSGVAKKTASTSRTSSRNASTGSSPGATSSSPSYGGIVLSPFQSSISIPDGASSRSARRSAVLFEPLRRLPL